MRSQHPHTHTPNDTQVLWLGRVGVERFKEVHTAPQEAEEEEEEDEGGASKAKKAKAEPTKAKTATSAKLTVAKETTLQAYIQHQTNLYQVMTANGERGWKFTVKTKSKEEQAAVTKAWARQAPDSDSDSD
jgi:hypothetical protein